VIIRPLASGDDAAVGAIFEATLALGRPLGFACPDLDAYRDLCLAWYLGPGRSDAVVAETNEGVVGYPLVATDGAAHARWARRAALGWAARTVPALVAGRYPPSAERFYRLRLRDGWASALGPPPPCPAHLHVNLLHGHRGGRAGRWLIDAAEDRLRAAGLDRYHGEINTPVGRRAAALERHGARVVHRQVNHTLSWLEGRPVERLRVVRRVEAGRPLAPVEVG
jgi:hypothetical protein